MKFHAYNTELSEQLLFGNKFLLSVRKSDRNSHSMSTCQYGFCSENTNQNTRLLVASCAASTINERSV